MPTDLAGQIENITFTNKENGFTVARVKVRGSRGLVTVAGTMMAMMAGEILEMHGGVVNAPQILKLQALEFYFCAFCAFLRPFQYCDL